MNYQKQLNPWVVYSCQPNLQRQFAARFRNRTQAEEYLNLRQRMQPKARFEIVYEVAQEEAALEEATV